MKTRFDTTAAPGAYQSMMALENYLHGCGLEESLLHLIKLRASQINGCAYCIDMHWAEARGDGEPEQRLAQLDAWSESPYFDERERAALTLTEAVTNVSSTNVPDETWAEAEAQFGPDELANLLVAIAMINAWNRIAIASRAQPASFHELPRAG